MTKKIMSIAAAAALLTSGASAFETNNKVVNGATTLLNINGTQGAYVTSGLVAPSSVLEVSGDHIGDALVFPAFQSDNGWSTEIVVRNNQNFAVVAKLVAYSAVDSQELRDFNIYLSANDVFRCTIKDGMITTNDDSVNIGAGWGKFENVTIPENTGYIAVYSMFALPSITDHGKKIQANARPAGTDIKTVIKDVYTNVLNAFRPGWNTKATISNGVFVKNYDDFNITSPKIPVAGSISDADNNTLSGTVRMSNADEPRDLILNAMAVDNYTTDGFVMAWAPNELAAWSDRNIVSNGPKGYDGYSKAATMADAKALALSSAVYTYNNGVDASESTDVQNKLVITQPTKRTLIQQGQGSTFWQQGLCPSENADPVKNGSTWGLVYGAQIWDEMEHMNTLDPDPELSPGNGTQAKKMCHEVGEIANIEAGTELEEKNGYAIVGFRGEGTPAIVTQMTASQVGDSREINWVNVPVKRKNSRPAE
jgi:hypothetical protein